MLDNNLVTELEPLQQNNIEQEIVNKKIEYDLYSRIFFDVFKEDIKNYGTTKFYKSNFPQGLSISGDSPKEFFFEFIYAKLSYFCTTDQNIETRREIQYQDFENLIMVLSHVFQSELLKH